MPQHDAWVRTIIDTVVDGIVIIDELGTIRLFNEGCQRLFGYAPEEVIGRNVKMLMPSPYTEQHDGYLQHYRDTAEKRIIGSGRNVQGRRRDGSVFPMYLSVGELPEEHRGEGGRFVGIIHDMTAELVAGEELRQTAARLHTIIESVPDAIIVIDERGRIDSFSSFAERLFGWANHEVAGKNVNLLMPEPYRSRHDGFLERYLTTGERRIIGIGRIVVGLRRDGSTFPMELAVGEMELSGRRLFTGFVRDLSERQLTEKRLQDLQSELLHVSRLSAMGEMAAALAHELNQPLTAVINWTQAARRLLDTRTETDWTKALGFMDNSIEQASRAGQIIRRLRNFVSKGESEPRHEAPNPIIEEAIALALVGARERSVRVTLDLGSDLPTVLADKVQIQQVMINLVRNAIEALAEVPAGRIALSARRHPDGRVIVAVADNGPGIAAEQRDRIFVPFFTTKRQGSGVGLTLVRQIATAHGATVDVGPTPGGGATVSLRF